MSLSRSQLILMAKVCEQSSRFEDMLKYMKKVAYLDQPLSSDERNLLSIAYKNCVGTRKQAWRDVSSIENVQQAKNPQNVPIIRDYRETIESELTQYSEEIIDLLDKKLLPESEGDKVATVFYYKLKGDYYRAMAEYATGENLESVSESALQAYTRGREIANSQLTTTHPVRLGLALNFSVFLHDVKENNEMAIGIAQNAHDDAISELGNLDDASFKEISPILSLLSDNLNTWKSDEN